MVALDWAVEVWNLPHNSPHEKTLGDIPNVIDLSFGKSEVDGGNISMNLFADDPLLDQICDPDATPPVSTLLRIYLVKDPTRKFVGAWLAENRGRSFEDDEGRRLVEISGPNVNDVTRHGAIPTSDYPENPSSALDWTFGGEGSAGSFENGDLEEFGTNLVPNGDFESGALDGWRSSSEIGGPGVSDLRTSSLRSNTGAWSLFCDPLNVIGSGAVSPDIPVVPGSRYLVTIKILQPTTIPNPGNRWTARIKMGNDGTIFHANGFRVGDKAYAEIGNVAKGTGATISGGLAPNNNTVWQNFTLDVTMGDFRENPEDTTQNTFIEIAWESGDSGSPPIYIDSITMIQTSGTGLAPWVAYTPATVALAVETVDVRTGARALRFTSNAFTGEGFPTGVQQLVTGLTGGDPYTFSAWVYNKQAVARNVRLHLRQPGSETLSFTEITIPGLTYAFGSVTAVSPLQSLLAEVRVAPSEAANLPLAFVVDDATFSGGFAPASPGDITLQLIAAIKARGRLLYLTTTTFTATTDSDGNAWADSVLSVVVPRGQTLEGWLQELGKWGYEWAVQWNGTTWDLRLWNPGGRGAVLPIGIVEGELITAGATKTSIPTTTSVFAEGAGGILDESATDAALALALGPRDAYLFAEDVTDQASLATRAAASLDRSSRYTAAARFVIDGAAEHIPGFDFDIGDTVTISTDDLSGEQRVISWNADLSDRSARFTLEVNERAAEDEALASIALNRVLEQFQRQRTVGAGAGEAVALPDTSVITVQSAPPIIAAADAPAFYRDAATFLCDGLNDEVQFRDAVNAYAAQNTLGDALLSPGTFFFGRANGSPTTFNGYAFAMEPTLTTGLREIRGHRTYNADPAAGNGHALQSSSHIVIDQTGGTISGANALIRVRNASLQGVSIRTTGGDIQAIIEALENAHLADIALHSTFQDVGVVSGVLNPESVIERISINVKQDCFRLNAVIGSTFRSIRIRGGSQAAFRFSAGNASDRTGSVHFALFDDIYILSGGSDAVSAVFRVTNPTIAGPEFNRNTFDNIRLGASAGHKSIFNFDATTRPVLDNWIGKIVDQKGTPATIFASSNGSTKGFRRGRVLRHATADFPAAADVIDDFRWDSTTGELKFSDGTTWRVVTIT